MKQSAGFSFIDVLLTLLLLTLSAMNFVSVSNAAAMATVQHARRVSAFQLASEFADWFQSGGGHIPLDDLAHMVAGDDDLISAYNCMYQDADSACSAEDSAKSYIAFWRSRLNERVPGVQVILCRDTRPWNEQAGRWEWSCAEAGTASTFIKLGWPADAHESGFPPILVLEIGVQS